jgi:hydroxymethylglutaryl-CoA lyase
MEFCKLVGNIATEHVIRYLESQGEDLKLNQIKWQEAMEFSSEVFI